MDMGGDVQWVVSSEAPGACRAYLNDLETTQSVRLFAG